MEPIELSIELPEGIIDCRLEPEIADGIRTYSVTILYPQEINGYNKSEIFCYTMSADNETGKYTLDYGDEGIHPKIKKLESDLAEAIASHK